MARPRYDSDYCRSVLDISTESIVQRRLDDDDDDVSWMTWATPIRPASISPIRSGRRRPSTRSPEALADIACAETARERRRVIRQSSRESKHVADLHSGDGRRRDESLVDSRRHLNFREKPGQYQSRDRAVSSPPCVYNRGSIKLPQFSGEESLSIFLLKFRNYQQYYSLSDRQALFHLRQALIGSAAEILEVFDGDCVLSDLIDELRRRFEPQDSADRYRQLLKNRRQGRGETLEALYLSILQLGQKAYNKAGGQLYDQLMKGHYVDAIYDPNLRLKLAELNPENIYEAHKTALRLQSVMANAEYDKRAVRTVTSQSGNDDARFKAIENKLQEVAKSLQSLAQRNENDRRQPQRDASSHTQRGRTRQSRACYLCNEIGHLIKNCPKKGQGESVNNRSRISTAVSDTAQSTIRASCTNEAASYNCMDVQIIVPHQKCGNSRYTKSVGRSPKRVKTHVVLDSGAEKNLAPIEYKRFCVGPLQTSHTKIFTASGQQIEANFCGKIEFLVGQKLFQAQVILSPDIDTCLLSIEWLKQNACTWDIGQNVLQFGDQLVNLKAYGNKKAVRRVIISEEAEIGPRKLTYVRAKLRRTSLDDKPSEWFIERAQTNGLLSARSITDDTTDIVVQVVNPLNHSIRVRSGTHLTNAIPIDNSLDDVRSMNTRGNNARIQNTRIKKQGDCAARVSMVTGVQNSKALIETAPRVATPLIDNPETMAKRETILSQLLNTVPSEISQDDRSRLEHILRANLSLFSLHPLDIGKVNDVEYDIKLKDEKVTPICEPLRRQSQKMNEIINKCVDDMIASGIAVENPSATWALNVVPVLKRQATATSEAEYKLAIDLRPVNRLLVGSVFPTNDLQLSLHSLARARYLAKMDISASYHCVCLSEKSRQILAFRTQKSTYNLTRLPYGLLDASNVFARVMATVLRPVNHLTLSCYVDDLTLGGTSPAQLMDDLEQLLPILRHAGLKLRPDKCAFLVTRAQICGFEIASGTISETNSTLDAIRRLQFPCTTRQLRSFIGRLQYTRFLHDNLAKYLAPFCDLLKGRKQSSRRIQCTPELSQAFLRLKEKMLSHPVLSIYRNDLPTLIQTDSSNLYYGAVLLNVYGDNDMRPCAYLSGRFNQQQQHWCISRKESAAGIFAVQKWKSLFAGAPSIIIQTDNVAFASILSKREISAQAMRWAEILAENNVKIQHVKGSLNGLADIMSRECSFEERSRPVPICSIENPCVKCRPSNKAGQMDEAAHVVTLESAEATRTDSLTQQRTPTVDRICCLKTSAIAITQNPKNSRQATLGDADNAECRPDDGSRQRQHQAYVTGKTGHADASSGPRAHKDGGKTRCSPSSVNPSDDSNSGGRRKAVQPLIGPGATITFFHEKPSQNSHAPTASYCADPATQDADDSHRLPTGHVLIHDEDEMLARKTLSAIRNLATAADVGVMATCPPTQADATDVTAAAATDRRTVSSQGGACVLIMTRQGQRREQKRAADETSTGPVAAQGAIDFVNWCPENLAELQRDDPTLKIVIEHLEAGTKPTESQIDTNDALRHLVLQWDSLIMIQRCLYRRFYDSCGKTCQMQFITPCSMRRQILQRIHTQVLCHARSFLKNSKSVQSVAYWQGWAKDIRSFVDSCPQCNAAYSRTQPRVAPIRCSTRASSPNQILRIDLVGPINVEATSFKYILSAQDEFSRKIFLYALKGKSTQEVADNLILLFLTHGMWQTIHSDRGREFRSNLMEDLARKFQCTRSCTLAYSPSQNGIERFHRTLHSLIARSLQKHSQWPMFLRTVERAHNGSVHASTNLSPDQIFYGRKLPNLLEVLLTPNSQQAQTKGEYMQEVSQRLCEINEAVLSHLKRKAVENEVRYNTSLKRPPEYHVGQRVFFFIPRAARGNCPKWHRYFENEAVIEKKLNATLYSIRPVGKRRTILVSADKLRECHSDP